MEGESSIGVPVRMTLTDVHFAQTRLTGTLALGDAGLDGDLALVLGEVLEVAGPFAVADCLRVDFLKLFGIGKNTSRRRGQNREW